MVLRKGSVPFNISVVPSDCTSVAPVVYHVPDCTSSCASVSGGAGVLAVREAQEAMPEVITNAVIHILMRKNNDAAFVSDMIPVE